MNDRPADPGDTRDRILTAALREYAEHGFKGATVRGIAEAAGVSPGLVQHHFPSKQALRDACDGFVFGYLREAKARTLGTDALSDPSFLADAHRGTVTITRYVAMALASDTPAASRYFDAYVDLTYETLTSGELGRTQPDEQQTRDVAVVLTAMQLGQSMLFTQMLRSLGLDADDPQTAARLGRARVFVSSDRVLDPEVGERIDAGLARYARTGGVDEGNQP